MDHELRMRLADILCGVEPLEVLKALQLWCLDQAAVANAEGDKYSEREYLGDAETIGYAVKDLELLLQDRYRRIGLRSLN